MTDIPPIEATPVWRCKLCPVPDDAYAVIVIADGVDPVNSVKAMTFHLADHHKVADRFEFVELIEVAIDDEDWGGRAFAQLTRAEAVVVVARAAGKLQAELQESAPAIAAALEETIDAWRDNPVKRSPEAWQQITGIRIADPDGWRGKGDPSWTTSITRDDFLARAMNSTVRTWPKPLLDEMEQPEPERNTRRAFCPECRADRVVILVDPDGPVDLVRCDTCSWEFPDARTVAEKIAVAVVHLREGAANPKVRVVHRSHRQQFPRESVMVFLGESSTPGYFDFSARPVAGTQRLSLRDIVEFEVVADARPVSINRVVRPVTS